MVQSDVADNRAAMTEPERIKGVSHDARDRRIVIDADQFSADYLLCIGAECKLIQEWLERDREAGLDSR